MSTGARIPIAQFPTWISDTLAMESAAGLEISAVPEQSPELEISTPQTPTGPDESVRELQSQWIEDDSGNRRQTHDASSSNPWWLREYVAAGPGSTEAGTDPNVREADFEALAMELGGMGLYRGRKTFPPPESVRIRKNAEVWVTRRVHANDSKGKVPFGYARIVEGADARLYIANENHAAPITQEIIDALAPVRDLRREAVEALNPSEGWKLHLNFEYRDSNVVSEIDAILERLEALKIIDQFKIGNAERGKEATVYIGDGSLARRVAALLQKHAAHLLLSPAGDTLTDDVFLTPLVMARFHISRTVDDFHQYGFHGVPFLRRDMSPWFAAPRDDEAARIAAWNILEYRYGVFFTGGFVGSTRPSSDG